MSLIISGAGLAPSNAQPGVFPNLARHTRGLSLDELIATYQEVDDAVKTELSLAGLSFAHLGEANEGAIDMGDDFRTDEVPTSIKGFWHHWKFERAWYYWRASGAGIPPDIAEEFHKTWGRQVRVGGDCTCPSPLEYCEGFAVDSYHIDTQEGLNAFMALLNKIYRPRKRDE